MTSTAKAMTMPILPAEPPKADATRVIFSPNGPGAIRLTAMAAVISEMKAFTLKINDQTQHGGDAHRQRNKGPNSADRRTGRWRAGFHCRGRWRRCGRRRCGRAAPGRRRSLRRSFSWFLGWRVGRFRSRRRLGRLRRCGRLSAGGSCTAASRRPSLEEYAEKSTAPRMTATRAMGFTDFMVGILEVARPETVTSNSPTDKRQPCGAWPTKRSSS